MIEVKKGTKFVTGGKLYTVVARTGQMCTVINKYETEAKSTYVEMVYQCLLQEQMDKYDKLFDQYQHAKTYVWKRLDEYKKDFITSGDAASTRTFNAVRDIAREIERNEDNNIK